MADDKNKPVETPTQLVTRAVKKYPTPSPQKQALAFNRVLKRHNFRPLETLIMEVLPSLKKKDQAQILLRLMDYQYPKQGTIVVKQRRPQKIQVNTQVNVPQSAAKVPEQPQPTTRPALAAANFEELLKIARSEPK